MACRPAGDEWYRRQRPPAGRQTGWCAACQMVSDPDLEQAGNSNFTGEALDEAYAPFSNTIGAAWGDGMVSRWSIGIMQLER
jgi:hypothetical protein